jgi:hypothetical protein
MNAMIPAAHDFGLEYMRCPDAILSLNGCSRSYTAVQAMALAVAAVIGSLLFIFILIRGTHASFPSARTHGSRLDT